MADSLQSSLVNKGQQSEAQSVRLILNNFFAGYHLNQTRRLYEDFNYQDKKPMYQEIVKQLIKEGMCLSALGTIQYDSETGQVTINNLLAILAGGLKEAVSILK